MTHSDHDRPTATDRHSTRAGRGILLVCLSAMILALGSVASAQTQSTTSGTPVPIASATTHITEPLLPDGRPDYIAHWNAELAAGIAPERNFWAALVSVVGDRVIPADTRRTFLRLLEVDPANVQDLYRPASSAPAFREAMRICMSGPWQRADYPDVADWIQRNHTALEALQAASERPDFYAPITTVGQDFRVLGIQIASIQDVSELGQALLCRAYLAAGEGRFDDTVDDLLTLYRIGALLGHDPVLAGRISAAAFSIGADRTTRRFLGSDEVPPDALRTLLDGIPESDLQNALAEILDTGGRYAVLDTAVAMAADPDAATRLVERIRGDKTESPRADALAEFISRGLLDQTDWEAVLVRANTFHDSFVQALEVPAYTWRQNALENVDQELGAIQREASILPWGEGKSYLASRENGVNAPTRWMGAFLIALMRSDITGPRRLMDQAVAERRLTRLATALELYRAENGAFPDSLGQLSPGYVAQVPKDHFTGRSLIYDVRDGHYVLYSVGPNSRDDGGMGPEKGGDDIVVHGSAATGD